MGVIVKRLIKNYLICGILILVLSVIFKLEYDNNIKIISIHHYILTV